MDPLIRRREAAIATHIIGAQRTRVGVAAGAIVLIVAGVLDATFGTEVALSYPMLMVTLGGLGIMVVAVGQRRTEVVLDDEGIRVRGGFGVRKRQYRWSELLEVGWYSPPSRYGWLLRIFPVFYPSSSAGCMVMVRPNGGRFDVPGPNSPVPIAVLAIFGSTAEDAARDVPASVCERHGVPFSGDGVHMLNQAPPGSPLRDAARKRPT